ncbi:proline-rich acidic protein 1-like isoform X3 [Athene cunicularia]|uniref:proline-rich acidic protein 1-like isoform X3 n=1 Tax=Athene cunicularia TaxID=194338 RepID=UPI000EF749A9|nr:proline-rich acidic protein 1-like isoform X3 [Athene cunicularia]
MASSKMGMHKPRCTGRHTCPSARGLQCLGAQREHAPCCKAELIPRPVSPRQRRQHHPGGGTGSPGSGCTCRRAKCGARAGQPTEGSHGAAPRDTEWQGVATEQDLAKETILGVQSVEALEEGETSNGLQPGIKVFSSSAWAQWGPRQAQVGPEEDRDHLHHPQDDAREDDPHGLPQTLALEVQSGPEEDRDHLHHG